jgi:DNA-3-methyladenine glycosylase I
MIMNGLFQSITTISYLNSCYYFDVQKIANYDKGKLQQLLTIPSIIRNRLKIQSVVKNARAFIRVQKEFGSFDSYLWSFVEGKPKHLLSKMIE